MSISAIVPVWNGRDLLARLLDSLDKQTLRAEEILAVDNGSTDGAAELARARGARVIPIGRNAGFAPAVNRGIKEANHEWLAILNSDVELAPDYFEKLTAAAAPFATGKILSPSGTIDGTFDVTARGAATWRAGSGMADGPPFDAARDICSPPWTAVLFRSEVFARTGLLEESFDSYLEDADFGLRCAGLGIRGRYVPEARAIHAGSASLGRWHPEIVRRIARNQVFLTARHPAAGLLWPSLVAQALWGAVAVRHGAGLAWLRGKWEGLRRFSALRRSAPVYDRILVEEIVRSNEQFIRETNEETYWRLYFMLTGGAK
ncbi:MAG TPA: glycosyltransferase family 2 protein [Candidatus Acidoferrales bacterium]|nr:glycosyltransferase family 2 protein [Candidatus Acidoferrales bacterium]